MQRHRAADVRRVAAQIEPGQSLLLMFGASHRSEMLCRSLCDSSKTELNQSFISESHSNTTFDRYKNTTDHRIHAEMARRAVIKNCASDNIT
jgi:hypothetical protein